MWLQRNRYACSFCNSVRIASPICAVLTGVVPAVRSIDCVSIFARSVGMAARALDVGAGFDDADPWSRRAAAAPLTMPTLVVGVPAIDAAFRSSQDAAAWRSSVAALGGLPMMCAYTGSKGAVTALARSVAVHCKRSGYRIRCNSIHPDGIWTPMTQALMPDLDPAALGIGSDPMARMCDPQDVANLVLFLASDESRFVNGAELRIDNAQLVSSL